MRLLRNSRGDTIVEVMIAMAVASAVLGGAYAVVNRTMHNSQQAQEHSQALQIADQQIERIITLATSTSANTIKDGTPRFNCTDLDDGRLIPQNSLLDLNKAGDFDGDCVSAGPVPYRVAFEYDPTAGRQYYRVTVIWPAATGKGEDRISLIYKAYQP